MGLTLHGYWRSGAAWRVRIALALKGLAHDACSHDLRSGAQRDADYRRLNPQGLVPALDPGMAGEAPLTQSLAIIEWLEETHPAPALLPGDALGRARVRAMAQVIACDVHPLGNLRVLQALKGDLGADDAQVHAWLARWMGRGWPRSKPWWRAGAKALPMAMHRGWWNAASSRNSMPRAALAWAWRPGRAWSRSMRAARCCRLLRPPIRQRKPMRIRRSRRPGSRIGHGQGERESPILHGLFQRAGIEDQAFFGDDAKAAAGVQVPAQHQPDDLGQRFWPDTFHSFEWLGIAIGFAGRSGPFQPGTLRPVNHHDCPRVIAVPNETFCAAK
ncbi:glutathione S-transferase N-terminal domain-containing protein [Novosphingobium pokkalii]|uniref:glutathione S-transferase N-terminal domain-containing protein n=1 Tax=Novosphingobium pokkalii TaxID=1770194 RepID=UPI00363B4A20